MTNQQGWLVRSVRPIEGTDFLSLTHLYQPLIGTDAFALYITLSFQLPFHRVGVSQVYTHSFLVNLLATTYDQLEKARYRLEGIGLLETYEKETDKWEKYLEYVLIPPLSPANFFSSDILGAMLWERIGKERFQSTREWLLSLDSTSKRSTGNNITKSFSQVYGVVSPQAMIQSAQLQEQTPIPPQEGVNGKRPKVPKQIDLEPIKMRLSSILKPEAWTKEIEAEIQEICFFYQLDSWGLIKALQNPEITLNGYIDLERLREYVRQEYRYQYRALPSVKQMERLKVVEEQMAVASEPSFEKKSSDPREEQHFQRLMEISPLDLLKYYQKGAQIARADVELVESLLTEFQLKPVVVNVLLDYVLLRHDRKLPRQLIEKIAGHWKRLGIETLEQARKQCLKEIEEVEGKAKRQGKGTSKIRESKSTIRRKATKNSLPEAVRNQLEGKPISEELSDEEYEAMRAEIMENIKMINENFEKRKKKQGEDHRL